MSISIICIKMKFKKWAISSVDTVKELATRRADNLCAKMNEVNEAKHLTKVVPTVAQLQKMIDQAKALPGVVTY